MKSNTLSKLITVTCAGALITGCLAACGSNTAGSADTATTSSSEAATEAVSTAQDASTESAASSEEATGLYFTKGVYVNYDKASETPTMEYFYIFDSDTTGHTERGSDGTGLPFECAQEEGKITFHFGGPDDTSVLTVSEKDANEIIYGTFEDKPEQAFQPLFGVDPEGFDAVEFVNGGGYATYNDANGWSVEYDPLVIYVNSSDDFTTFVYMGNSAGTNMITATYTPGKTGKEISEEFAKNWGETATTSEGTFPGTEDVKGYWAELPPSAEGSGLYETAIARDYKDGALSFELTGHNSGDDELDMEVSDHLAMIIDSIQFKEK